MKILIIHNEYKLKSGEETAVDNEVAALVEREHDVITYFVSNSDINNIFKKIAASFSAIWSFKHKRIISDLLSTENPDIVHVHNSFPLISPSVFYACNEANIPCIHTLHNYRIFCPSTTLFHNKNIYKEGLNGNYFKVISDRVYRRSFFGTTLVTIGIIIHRFVNTWGRIDALIALSEFQKRIFDEKIKANVVVLPHFTAAPTNLDSISVINKPPSHFHIYAGRLDHEKGILVLIENWPSDENLIIVGSGPLEKELKKRIEKRANIYLYGHKPKNTVLKLMSKARSCVVPSMVHETFGLTIIESLSVGTPVVANNLEPFRSLITEGETGFLIDLYSRKSLDEALKKILSNNNYLRSNCLDHYHSHYTKQVGVARLEELFFELIENRKNH